VEYLGRYLGQDSPAADEAWDDVDPDADIGEWDGSPTVAHNTTNAQRTFTPSFGAGEAPGDGAAAPSPVAGRKPVDGWAEDRPDAQAPLDLDPSIDIDVDAAGATPADSATDDSDNAPYDGTGDPPGEDDLG
jgi:hypothetical protein